MENMEKLINKDLLSHLKLYFDKIYESKLELEIDGVKGFNSKSQFVEGKVVNACSYVFESLPDNDENKSEVTKKVIEIISIMSERTYETWGILNCITALNRLRNKKQLDLLISPDVLKQFKEKLDWRTFVNTDDLTLIDKPTNYYGVAFGIAKYRELLGFEPVGWSEKLLVKLLKHVDNFSGEYMFMDETDGHGRFDRYSILIPAEICSMLYDTGCEIPSQLIDMLRKSCNIFLQLANIEGKGFSYGRSIGAYGDSATIEVLSIGAMLGILNSDELDIAYSYCCKATERFINFWIDRNTLSLNMWDKGRRTDDYRNKNRILGENLSLSMQLIHGYEYWKACGFSDKEPNIALGCNTSTLPKYSVFKFAEGQYNRRLYVIREGDHVITLPLINGSDKYYNQTPYLPIPNEFNVFTSAANSVHPNLVPKLIFNDGSEVMPIVYINKISDNLNKGVNNSLVVDYHLDHLALLGEDYPREYKGISAEVSYSFSINSIGCSIVFNFGDKERSDLSEVVMEFATFSKFPRIHEKDVRFDEGTIGSIKVTGLEKSSIHQDVVDKEYSTPVGQLETIINYSSSNKNLILSKDSNNVEISWEVTYK